MERTSFYQRVIELANDNIGPVCIQRNISPKEALPFAIANQLLFLASNYHSEALVLLEPFLLAAARQILNPVPDVTDEDREMVNTLARNKLNINHSK